MRQFLLDWYRRYFSNPEIAALLFLLLIILGMFWGLGPLLTPVFAALIIAYLLEWCVHMATRLGMRRILAVWLVFAGFCVSMVWLVFVLVPLFWQQISDFLQQLPDMIVKTQTVLRQLPERYPQFISPQQIQAVTDVIRDQLAYAGQLMLSTLIDSALNVAAVIVYLILVPVLVFFMLKDKRVLMNWLAALLPPERGLVLEVWQEVKMQIGNYVRGKVLQILIVSVGCYAIFAVLGLHYALLLAVLVGLAVLIPYVGVTAMTLPVLLVGYFQWGLSAPFAYLIASYAFIHLIDGNVIVPILFAEVVNLHPVAIIVAVLVFGGLWGFWGVFFAIPLATLVHAILKAWRKTLVISY